MEDSQTRRADRIDTELDRTAHLDAEAPCQYVDPDPVVESDHPEVVALGRQLRSDHSSEVAFARAAFEWVRDNIAHSYDVGDSRVTLTASEVLHERVGLCYAKSNLLAAILRSQGLPAGLCYQRVGDPTHGYSVHGLVAIYLNEAWHRQDPRGNKPGIDAQFSLDAERLAFPIDESLGERDYPRLYESPAAEIVVALKNAHDILTCPLPSDLR